MTRQIDHRDHPWWDPASRFGPHPPPFRSHSNRKPVKGGRWFIRKAPHYVRAINHPKRWKAYNLSSRGKWKNKYFETHDEAFKYAERQTFIALENWANGAPDSKKKASARIYVIQYKFGILPAQIQAAQRRFLKQVVKFANDVADAIHKYGPDSL